MKYKYFSDHIKALEDYYNKGVVECNKILGKKEYLEAEIRRISADTTLDDRVRAARLEALKVELDIGVTKELRQKVDEIRAGVAPLRADLAADIKEFTLVSPKKVDNETMSLINAGVLSPEDLVALSNHHWDNTTMLKVISSEAKKHFDNSKIARVLGSELDKFLSPETRMAVFNSGEYILTRTFRDSGYNPVFIPRAPELFEGVYQSMKELDSLATMEV